MTSQHFCPNGHQFQVGAKFCPTCGVQLSTLASQQISTIPTNSSKTNPQQVDIVAQKELLEVHRRTLAVYLRQRAILSEAYTPPGVEHGISEARENIKRIKNILRGWNVAIDDYPDDDGTNSVIPNRISQLAELKFLVKGTFIKGAKGRIFKNCNVQIFIVLVDFASRELIDNQLCLETTYKYDRDFDKYKYDGNGFVFNDAVIRNATTFLSRLATNGWNVVGPAETMARSIGFIHFMLPISNKEELQQEIEEPRYILRRW